MRIITSIALIALFTFISPATSRADDITLRLEHVDGLSISFGLNPFTVTSPFTLNINGDFDVDGSVSLVSGPLLDLDMSVDGLGRPLTTYSYGAGTIDIDASWTAPNGTHHDGTYRGEVLPFWLTVCEGCDTLFGKSQAEDFVIELGTGRFDRALARLFGVERSALGGAVDFGLEDIDGDATSPTRTGFDHRGGVTLTIRAQEVPEPGLLLLGIAAGAGWMARRHRSQAG